MSISIDPKNPLGSLQEAGIGVKQTHTEEATSILVGGIQVAGATADGERFEFSLPKEAGFSVMFGPEVLSSQIVKLFKAELQLGDQAFDDVVYISTDNEERVARLLEPEALRRAVHDVVMLGGTVAVEGQQVTYHLIGETTHQDYVVMAEFVAAVLA